MASAVKLLGVPLDRAAAIVLALVVVVLPAVVALGHGFGSSANPDHYVADSSLHTWSENEGNDGEFFAMIGPWLDSINGQFKDRTDMNAIQESYTTDTDVYWFVTPAVGTADAVCVDFSAPLVCNQARVRFNTNWAFTQPLAERRQGACHEIGHTVGFDDSQPEVNTGCMSGGGQGVLSSHEIQHIDDEY